jgi:hypothetical protein
MKARPCLIGSVVAALGASVLAACGSSATTSTTSTVASPAEAKTSAAGATEGFDSCSVVTQEDASRALGETVGPGVLGNATVEGGRACVFYGSAAPNPGDPNTAQPDSVRVVVVKGSDASKWYSDYKTKVDAQPVSGYGDEAFFDGHASLSILDGASYVRVAVIPALGAPSLSSEQALASTILPKL